MTMTSDKQRDRDVTAQTLEALLLAITNRLTEVTIAKVKGRQGRKGTRHWTPTAGEPLSTKALDPTTVVDPDQWRQQVEQAGWQVLGPAGAAAGNRLRAQLTAAGVQPAPTQTVPQQQPLNQVPPIPPQGSDGDAHPVLDYAIYRAVRWLADAGANKAQQLRDKIAAAEQADLERARSVAVVNKVAAAEGASVEPIVAAVRDWQTGPDGTTGLASWARTRAEGATTAAIEGVHHGLLVNLPGVHVTRTWRTRQDDRVRHAHRLAEGQQVDGEDPFTVGGERLRYPGDPLGSPGNVINCRCRAAYRVTAPEPAYVPAEAKDLVRTVAGSELFKEPIGAEITRHDRIAKGQPVARPGTLPGNLDAVGWGYDRTESLTASRSFLLSGLAGRDEHGSHIAGHPPADAEAPDSTGPTRADGVEAKQQVAADLAGRMTQVPDADLIGMRRGATADDAARAADPSAVWLRFRDRWELHNDVEGDDAALVGLITSGKWDEIAKRGAGGEGWGDLTPYGENPKGSLAVGGPDMVRQLREQAVSDLVGKWAETSNDHSGWSLAMQQVIAEEFGIEDAHDWQPDEDTQADLERILNDHRPVLAAFAHAQYQATQERLAEHGIETLNLYRGMHWDNPDDVPEWARGLTVSDAVEVPLRPASSFTANGESAVFFARVGGIVGQDAPASLIMSGAVPADRIFATPRTGVGCLAEWEFVVLGGPAQFSVVGENLGGEDDELSDHDLGWMPVGSLNDEDVLRALTLNPDDKRRRELLKRADDLGIQMKALPEPAEGSNVPQPTTGNLPQVAAVTPDDVRNEDWIKTRGWDVRDYAGQPIAKLEDLAARLDTDEAGAKEWLATMPAGEAAPPALRSEAGIRRSKRQMKADGSEPGMDNEIKGLAETADALHRLVGADLTAFDEKHPRGVHGRFAHTWQRVMHSHQTRDRAQVVADVLSPGASELAPEPLTWRKHLDGFVTEDGGYYIERRIAGNRLYARAGKGDAGAEELTDAPFPYGRLVGTGQMGELRTKADEDAAKAANSVSSHEGGRSDESTVRSDGGSQLAEGRPGSVRADQGQAGVLPGVGGGSAEPDRRGDAVERGRAGGDVRAAGDAVGAEASGGGGDRGPGTPSPAADRPADRDAGPVVRDSPAGPGDTGGPGTPSGAERLAGRGDGVSESVERPADAGEPADTVITEADRPEADPSQMPVVSGGQDFRPTGIDDLTPAGKAAKLEANMAALRLLRQMQAEHRTSATPEEQAVLAKWAGWGGLPEVFDPRKPQHAKYYGELERLMTPSEIAEARLNTLNAHYTDARVVEQIWRAVNDLGFDGGRVLEPGSGSGTFIGYAPPEAHMVGVELDSTTAAISQYLYPSANIRNEGFEKTNVPDGAFDMTIGNVPFGKYPLTDRRHNPTGESIHNHFILKSLALTRPGGIVAVLTSRNTLDSQSTRARKLMAEKADLIGAIRLPTGSHMRASETQVIEDILFFRVREPDEPPQEDQSWITAPKKELDGWKMPVNDYWAEHPDNVLGSMEGIKGRYGGEMVVKGDKGFADLPAAIDRVVATAKAEGLTATPSDRGDVGLPDLIAPDLSRHEGHIQAEVDGTFTQAQRGASVPFAVPTTQAGELRQLIGLRDNLRALLDAESKDSADSPQIKRLRDSLSARYDAYVSEFGPINRFDVTKSGARKSPGQGGFRSDPQSAIVRALEEYDPVSKEAKKADIFTKRAVAPRELRTTADNPQDALTLSMEQYGEVDLPAIAKMLGVDEPTARRQLGGLVFEQPPLTDEEQAAAEAVQAAERLGDITAADAVDLSSVGESVRQAGALETASGYLSGNVRRKLAAARAAAQHDPRFQANVDALEKVIPTELGPQEIDGRLGASWIGPADVEAFIRQILNEPQYSYRPNSKVQVAHSGGSIWTVKAPRNGTLATQQWGTPDRPAPELIHALLEQRPIKVTREVSDGHGGTKNVPDLEATLAAQEKAAEIQQRFSEWLWEDPDRARRLQATYNDLFNSIVLRQYEADPNRTFDGMSETWQRKILPHVKAAGERIVQEPTVLLAHVVGAGKTAEMAIGTQELRRLGLARKPCIVIPNHMLEQFEREYLEIYPQARILAAGTKDLEGDKRREFVARAATGDWDAVIMTQTAFEKIPMSPEATQAYIDREMQTMRDQLAQAQANPDANEAQKRTVKKMETALKRAEEALKKKLDKNKDSSVTFEQTGIDYVMVDEAHMYSNLRTLSNINAANIQGSDRATDLHMKIEHLRANSTSGRVATFASGTPIRNTVTQAYVMMRFLRPDLLEDAGIHTFDQWAAAFGDVVSEMELKPEGKGFRQSERFARFRNVPELLRIFHAFSDVKMAEDLNLRTPDIAGGKMETVVVPASDALRQYVSELGDRADKVRAREVEPEVDNMLKISGDGRKAALSMKLVGGDEEPGKIEAAADRISSIHEANKDRVYHDPETGVADKLPGSLQIVFLDMGTPKDASKKGKKADDEGEFGRRLMGDDEEDESLGDWTAYQALKDALVARGVPAEQIAFIHDAKNDAQKAEMFAAARNGRIQVLLGSSDKMGVGTNIQRRAIALHHMDAPWRPADVEQRDGRLVRQGNLHRDMGIPVQVINYVTEHSFDAYMWQTLERKSKFIHQIMRGNLDVREIDDIGDQAMTWAEVKAVTTGDPAMLDKAKADTEATKLERLERAHNRQQTNMQAEHGRISRAIPEWEATAAQYDDAIAKRKDTRGDAFAMTIDGDVHGTRADAGKALLEHLDGWQDRAGYYSRDPHPVGQLGGHTVVADVRHDYRTGSRVIQLRFADVPGDAVAEIPVSKLGTASGTGTITRLENALQAFESRRDRLREAVAKGQDEIERMNERIGQPFPRADELAGARVRQAQINDKIAASIAADEAAKHGARVEDEPPAAPTTAPPVYVIAGLRLTNDNANDATYQQDTGEDVPADIELWRATLPGSRFPVWLAFHNQKYLGHGMQRSSLLEEVEWYRSHDMLPA